MFPTLKMLKYRQVDDMEWHNNYVKFNMFSIVVEFYLKKIGLYYISNILRIQILKQNVLQQPLIFSVCNISLKLSRDGLI